MTVANIYIINTVRAFLKGLTGYGRELTTEYNVP